MRALTLTQPWCGLIAANLKLIENRPRAMIKREDFGKPFAVHASREIDPEVFDRIYGIAPELHHNLAVTQELTRWHRLARITSAVIAVATIDDVIGGEPRAHVETFLAPDQRRWYFGPIGYLLRDVRVLAEPVLCRGHQGFWTLDEATAAMVATQLGGA